MSAGARDGRLPARAAEPDPVVAPLPLLVLLVALYGVLSWPTLWLYTLSADVPAVYFPAGVVWAGVVLLARGHLLAFIAACAALQLAGEFLIYRGPLPLALVITFSKVLGPAIGAAACERLSRRATPFRGFGDQLRFAIVGGVITPLLMAAPPQLVKVALFDVGALDYLQWTLIDVCGIVVMAPLLMHWLRPCASPVVGGRREASLLALATAVILALVFGLQPLFPDLHAPFYAITPLLLWGAARYGVRGASLMNVVVAAALIGSTLVAKAAALDTAATRISVTELELFIVVMAVMSLLLGALADDRERARLVEEADRRRLRDLSVRLLLNEEAYRNRVATRLHDGIGQSLALGRMRLEDLDPAVPETLSAGGALGAVRRAIDTATTQVRDMTRDVAAGLYRNDDLAATVRRHLADIFDGTGCEATLDSEALPELRHGVAVVVSRAIRECLVNAAKHAEARHVTVSLGVHGEPGALVVRIRDDGVGFSPQQIVDAVPDDSFGIASVRNSMLALGGGFDVRAAAGAGTTVTLSVPLTRAARALVPG